MKRARWGCSEARYAARAFALLACLACGCAPAAGAAAIVEPTHGAVLVDARESLPPEDAPWREVTLPDPTHNGAGRAVWLRIPFERRADGESWALYIPYLYGGGQVWLNRTLLATVPEADAAHHVRWERPHLIGLPESRLQPGTNVLHIRVVAADPPNGLWLARPSIGAQAQLLDLHDRRQLWMRTMPQVTVGVCLLFAAVVGLIWLRRRGEVLYGLFGLAAALWGVRTLTFVVETLPSEHWWLWRVVYHGATGGFIAAMAVFAMRFAGVCRPRVEWALLAYSLVGPLVLLASGGRAEYLVGRLWTLGTIPIGITIVAMVGLAWWRRRSAETALLLAAVALAVAAGIHDYLVAWHVAAFDRVLPGWPGHRLFLMHFGANLVLLVMAGLLTARFVRTLSEVEELNATLERRVAAREAELAGNYERLAALERDRAASDERHRIMRDLHDGLGSQLFTSLSRVERGGMERGEIADVLRQCIADMRLALEALSSDDQDFRTALGNFLFRWEGPLREAGIRPAWRIEVPDASLQVPPHLALQLLRVLQEALTNVLKHAHATEVCVELRESGERLVLSVEDDGCGLEETRHGGGRGLANMRARAQRIGAVFDLRSQPGRTRIALELPRPQVAAAGRAQADSATAHGEGATAGAMTGAMAAAGLPIDATDAPATAEARSQAAHAQARTATLSTSPLNSPGT